MKQTLPGTQPPGDVLEKSRGFPINKPCALSVVQDTGAVRELHVGSRGDVELGADFFRLHEKPSSAQDASAVGRFLSSVTSFGKRDFQSISGFSSSAAAAALFAAWFWTLGAGAGAPCSASNRTNNAFHSGERTGHRMNSCLMGDGRTSRSLCTQTLKEGRLGGKGRSHELGCGMKRGVCPDMMPLPSFHSCAERQSSTRGKSLSHG